MIDILGPISLCGPGGLNDGKKRPSLFSHMKCLFDDKRLAY